METSTQLLIIKDTGMSQNWRRTGAQEATRNFTLSANSPAKVSLPSKHQALRSFQISQIMTKKRPSTLVDSLSNTLPLSKLHKDKVENWEASLTLTRSSSRNENLVVE
eukprot:TRINITY_DN8476_c0_g2_i1.p1 TRINITY_DN8476_c0_g2~~TRINITY_DN8476_c0_g2_i1.p1  ORF type:complete len:108 (+),score=12.51 TRINITY_DN8476_c0_g2_i1:582-905(+)